ncbi:MAG: acyltransferase [Clostridiales bacterium]|nr:acyltransferase [Clostridiales bacterium]
MDRIKALDMLKGISIIMVVLTHFSWSDQERLVGLFPFWIAMAVPIFMMVSGYTFAMSFERHGVSQIEDAYNFIFIVKKILRYTLPFAVVYLIEIIYENIHQSISFGEACRLFLVGGNGPGSYYYPCMIQLIFLMPLIYFPIKKNPRRGIRIAFLVNAVYEVLQNAYELNETCYRLLVFRYIFALACGCYFYFMKDTIYLNWKTRQYKLPLFGGGILGIIFIVMYNYLGFNPPILKYWIGTSFITILYIFPVFILLFKILSEKSIWILELIGKNSYEIFLVQKIFPRGYLYQNVSSRVLQLFVYLCFCITAGVIMGRVMQPGIRTLISKIEVLLHKESIAIEYKKVS